MNPDPFLDPETVTLNLTVGELCALALMLSDLCIDNAGALSYVVECAKLKVKRALCDAADYGMPAAVLDGMAAESAQLAQWRAELTARGLLQ